MYFYLRITSDRVSRTDSPHKISVYCLSDCCVKCCLLTFSIDNRLYAFQTTFLYILQYLGSNRDLFFICCIVVLYSSKITVIYLSNPNIYCLLMTLKPSMPYIPLTVAFYCSLILNIHSIAVLLTVLKIHSTAVLLTVLNIHSTAVLLTVLNIYSTAVLLTVLNRQSTAVLLTVLNIHSTALLLTVLNIYSTAVLLTLLNIYSTAVLLTVYSSKASVIAFTGVTNIVYYNYKLLEYSLTCACVNCQRLCGATRFKTAFPHTLIDCIFSQSVRMLDFIQSITDFVSTLESSLIMCLTPVRPKLQYPSVVWNSITPTDGKKVNYIQQKFIVICQQCVFTYYQVSQLRYFLKFLKLYSLYISTFYFALLTCVCLIDWCLSGEKSCDSDTHEERLTTL